MAAEAKLQADILKWLRSKGAWCMKVQAGPGVPKGTADIFWCYRKAYGWLEVKASGKAKKQVGQQEFIDKQREWGAFARFVCPENFEEIKEKIMDIIRREDEALCN